MRVGVCAIAPLIKDLSLLEPFVFAGAKSTDIIALPCICACMRVYKCDSSVLWVSKAHNVLKIF